MSYPALGRIWALLNTRRDVGNIVKELIGQHALESSELEGEENQDELLNVSFKYAIYVKVFFDLQRVYLGCSEPSQQSLSHLLPLRQLYLLITWLLRLKSRLFPGPFPPNEYEMQR